MSFIMTYLKKLSFVFKEIKGGKLLENFSCYEKCFPASFRIEIFVHRGIGCECQVTYVSIHDSDLLNNKSMYVLFLNSRII